MKFLYTAVIRNPIFDHIMVVREAKSEFMFRNMLVNKYWHEHFPYSETSISEFEKSQNRMMELIHVTNEEYKAGVDSHGRLSVLYAIISLEVDIDI